MRSTETVNWVESREPASENLVTVFGTQSPTSGTWGVCVGGGGPRDASKDSQVSVQEGMEFREKLTC